MFLPPHPDQNQNYTKGWPQDSPRSPHTLSELLSPTSSLTVYIHVDLIGRPPSALVGSPRLGVAKINIGAVGCLPEPLWRWLVLRGFLRDIPLRVTLPLPTSFHWKHLKPKNQKSGRIGIHTTWNPPLAHVPPPYMSLSSYCIPAMCSHFGHKHEEFCRDSGGDVGCQGVCIL